MPKGRGVLSHLPWGRGAKGVFPSTPDIAGLELEELHALRNSG